MSSILRLESTFHAPRGAVFRAWTSPALLRRWWASQPGWHCVEAEVDLRVGGAYRLSMQDPDAGETYTVIGEYREVTPPERLVYTWTWEHSLAEPAGGAGTLVTVEFVEAGDTTIVLLAHEGFETDHVRELHSGGWERCLDSLEARVFGDDPP